MIRWFRSVYYWLRYMGSLVGYEQYRCRRNQCSKHRCHLGDCSSN